MSAADRLRVGDRERESATAALGEHYSTGRLTRDELDERSRRALEARTAADLQPLFADLPLPHGPLGAAGRAAPPSGLPSGLPVTPGRRGPRFPWIPVAVALVALTVITDRPWIWFGVLAWAVWALLTHRRRAERRRARREARRDAWMRGWQDWQSWGGHGGHGGFGGWHHGRWGSGSTGWSGSWSGACGPGGAQVPQSRGSGSRRS